METVSIRIPAAPRYVQVVRLVAAGLAARLGFTIDDIEDLKIAVDELAAYLTGNQGRDGRIDVDFTITDDGIEIFGRARFSPGQKVRADLTEFSQMILETVADSASLELQDGAPVFKVTKTKRRPA
jgi:serine/threonine-protein kinase RsbW